MFRGRPHAGQPESARGQAFASESITLNVKDVINFNKHLVGDNLFIMD